MSWDDIVIGKGNKGSSAITRYKSNNTTISENSVSYWITNVLLNNGLTIFKYTDEGIRLKNILDQNEPKQFIDNFIIDIILKNIQVYKFNEIFDKMLKDAFKKGMKFKEAQFRQVLGLED